MSTIAVLTIQESGANSLTDINNNFANLNTDKVESTGSVSVDSEVAIYSGAGGKTLKRASATGIAKLASGVLSAVTAPSGAIVGDTDAQNLTNKTLTTPTIASFTNATHNHTNAAGGGTLAEGALALTDITTNNASASKHGFLPKLSGSAADSLKGDGTWSATTNSAKLYTDVVTAGTAVSNTTTTVYTSTVLANTFAANTRMSLYLSGGLTGNNSGNAPGIITITFGGTTIFTNTFTATNQSQDFSLRLEVLFGAAAGTADITSFLSTKTAGGTEATKTTVQRAKATATLTSNQTFAIVFSNATASETATYYGSSAQIN